MRASRIGIAVAGLTVALTAATGTDARGDPWEAYMDAASLAEADGRLEDAERALLEARRQAERPGGARINLALAVEALADFYHRAGRGAEAEPLYLRSVELWESLLGPGQPRTGIPVHNLAVVYLGDCRVEEALPLIDRVLDLWERTLGPDHPDRVLAIRSEANGLRACDRPDEAAKIEALLEPTGP